jgi:RimJ/RimL family protein N-acetyltransferase
MTTLELRVLEASEKTRAEVASIMRAAEDYYINVQGTPAPPEEAEEFFSALPPGYEAKDLFPLGFYADGKIAGIGGMLRHWNAPNKAMIGLLIVDPALRRKGAGREAVGLMENLARTWPGIDRLRVGVVACNARAVSFWQAVGYEKTGEIKPRFEPFLDDVVILEKDIA